MKLFNSKKGQMFPGRMPNIILGLITLAAGALPLLSLFGIKLLGSFVMPPLVFPILLVVSGLLFLIDAMMGVM